MAAILANRLGLDSCMSVVTYGISIMMPIQPSLEVRLPN
jgi:hypothetical protein